MKADNGTTQEYTCPQREVCDLDQAQMGVNNTYGYDANGNQITRTINGVTLTLAYDAEGHLISVTGPSITPAEGAKYQSSVKMVMAKRGG